MTKAQSRRSSKNKNKYANQFQKTIKNKIRKLKKLILKQPKNNQLEKSINKLESSSGRIKKSSKKL